MGGTSIQFANQVIKNVSNKAKHFCNAMYAPKNNLVQCELS